MKTKRKEVLFTCPWCYNTFKNEDFIFSYSKPGKHYNFCAGTANRKFTSAAGNTLANQKNEFVTFGLNNGFIPVYAKLKSKENLLIALREKTQGKDELYTQRHCRFCECVIPETFGFTKCENIVILSTMGVDASVWTRNFIHAMSMYAEKNIVFYNEYGISGPIEKNEGKMPVLIDVAVEEKKGEIKHYYLTFLENLLRIKTKDPNEEIYRNQILSNISTNADRHVLLTRMDDEKNIIEATQGIRTMLNEQIESKFTIDDISRCSGCVEIESALSSLRLYERTEKTAVVFVDKAVMNKLAEVKLSGHAKDEPVNVKYIPADISSETESRYIRDNLNAVSPEYSIVLESCFPGHAMFTSQNGNDMDNLLDWIFKVDESKKNRSV